jgi:predicted nucleotidyltransferase
VTPSTDKFDWSHYKGNLNWLQKGTIFLCKAGSHAYGTNTPASDLDIRGVAIPPLRYFYGFLNKFEQAEMKGEIDGVIYDVRKFVALAVECNPNIIELLFTDESDWLVTSPAWSRLHFERESFLTKAARHRFAGYAFSQLKRIKSHRSFLLNPRDRKPERADFGLPEHSTIPKEELGLINSRIQKREDVIGGLGVQKGQIADEEIVVEAMDGIISSALIAVVIAERKYVSASREYNSYQTWKTERNPARAALEAKSGYDTKHGAHLVRLMRMCAEILEGKGCVVKRPDAEELLAIRNGAWSYDQLIEYAERADKEMEIAYQNSKLPHGPDRAGIDRILCECVHWANPHNTYPDLNGF